MGAKKKTVGAFAPPPDPLVEDVKEILVEGIFTSNWTRIETYHSVGKRLLEEKDLDKATSLVTEAIPQVSERQLQRCVQFARKFPDLDKLKAGKNITWRRICLEYLPVHKEDTWSWRLTDRTLINGEFLSPDRQKIDAQVKSMGPRAVEFVGKGIEVYREDQ